MARYYRPRDIADALQVLREEDARLLLGGTDLLVGLRHHTVDPDIIVDLKTASDLRPPISISDDGVSVGPALTMAALASTPQVQEWFPGLVEAALTVGSVAIRNRASLIGNICNGSPAADTAPALLVHRARVTIASISGERTVPLSEFFLAPRKTQCAASEIVTALEIPRPADGSASAFQRLTRRRGVDLATVSVAAAVSRRGDVSLGIGAMGPTTIHAEIDEPIDATDAVAVDAALDPLLEVLRPISDVRASKEYRAAMVRVLARRAVLAAANRRTPERLAS
ncbi:MAG TPA: FAD binding domain-containing protein [Microbacterium sp.]|uniref:FAD binding domain-containing protein n=1 Tax=Microbacterium sp. TaxID=51671 RepID=UPI002C1E86AB|nr:FAD binding domain-containing protein [Microbacterium sp.]HWI32165.1 FAD binding domain-containing protein [Microbacterium sp.]